MTCTHCCSNTQSRFNALNILCAFSQNTSCVSVVLIIVKINNNNKINKMWLMIYSNSRLHLQCVASKGDVRNLVRNNTQNMCRVRAEL